MREKPTKEQIEQFKKEFEDANKKFIESTYTIGNHDNAIKYINNILKWVNRWTWQDNQWQGVIAINKELNAELERVKNDKDAVLTLTSGALSFVIFVLDHQNGKGLPSAKMIEKELPDMIEIYDLLKAQATISAELITEAANAQQRWQIAEQGFWSKLNEKGEVVPDINEEEYQELMKQNTENQQEAKMEEK